MNMVILNLVPLIFAATVGAPMWTIMMLLLLRSEGGMIKAMAFALGATTIRVLQGFLFGSVCGEATDASDADLITLTLLVVVGVFLLITAIKVWRKQDDPDAPPPRWMMILGGASAPMAFGIGVLMMATTIKQWVFTLSAIAVINEAKLGPVSSVLAYIFYVVAAQSLMLAPIVSSVVAPIQSARMLDLVQDWLERNNRAITIVASLIFGVWFLAKGTTGLLAHGDETAITNAHN